MGRPRKPTAALELSGAFKRNPSRKKARAAEPQPGEPLGQAPATFDAGECSLWQELSAHGFWLTGADRLLLEIAVKLMAQFRSGMLDNSCIAKLITALAKLGFSPVDRGKVHAPGGREPKADPYAEFR